MSNINLDWLTADCSRNQLQNSTLVDQCDLRLRFFQFLVTIML